MNRPLAPNDPATEPLADALRRAAADLAGHVPPAAVQAAVLARLAPRVQPAAQPVHAGVAAGSRRGVWAPWATATLCGVLLLASTALLLRPSSHTTADVGWAADAASLGFLPAASAERWLGNAATAARPAPAWVVSAELPRERLVEFGLPYDPSRAADTVRAELLLRGNGDVMAVRVLESR